jgi:hypothetical protein
MYFRTYTRKHPQSPVPSTQYPIPTLQKETFFRNADIGSMNAILVSLVVCVHINSIFGIDRGEYKICS